MGDIVHLIVTPLLSFTLSSANRTRDKAALEEKPAALFLVFFLWKTAGSGLESCLFTTEEIAQAIIHLSCHP